MGHKARAGDDKDRTLAVAARRSKTDGRGGRRGRVLRNPRREATPAPVDQHLIVEFYAR
jgi:hypothetical protein